MQNVRKNRGNQKQQRDGKGAFHGRPLGRKNRWPGSRIGCPVPPGGPPLDPLDKSSGDKLVLEVKSSLVFAVDGKCRNSLNCPISTFCRHRYGGTIALWPTSASNPPTAHSWAAIRWMAPWSLGAPPTATSASTTSSPLANIAASSAKATAGF